MLRSLIMTIFAAFAMSGQVTPAAAQEYAGGAIAPSLFTSIDAVREAADVETAAAAFDAAAVGDQENLTLNQAYVSKMIELGVPDLAYEHALLVVEDLPDDGLSLGVISFTLARDGKMPEALATIVQATWVLYDDPFVLRTAGQLSAWLDFNSAGVAIEDDLRQAVALMRRDIGGSEDFVQAYAEAKLAYEELARAEALAALQADAADDYDARFYATPTYVTPAPVVVEYVYTPTLVVFIGRVRFDGLWFARSCGRDVFIDHGRSIYVGRARHFDRHHRTRVVINDARTIIADDASRVVRDRKGRLFAQSARHELKIDRGGKFIATRSRDRHDDVTVRTVARKPAKVEVQRRTSVRSLAAVKERVARNDNRVKVASPKIASPKITIPARTTVGPAREVARRDGRARFNAGIAPVKDRGDRNDVIKGAKDDRDRAAKAAAGRTRSSDLRTDLEKPAPRVTVQKADKPAAVKVKSARKTAAVPTVKFSGDSGRPQASARLERRNVDPPAKATRIERDSGSKAVRERAAVSRIVTPKPERAVVTPRKQADKRETFAPVRIKDAPKASRSSDADSRSSKTIKASKKSSEASTPSARSLRASDDKRADRKAKEDSPRRAKGGRGK